VDKTLVGGHGLMATFGPSSPPDHSGPLVEPSFQGREVPMAEILLHQKQVKSVFHLLGERENDITYSVAWALAQSPRFLTTFVRNVLGIAIDSSNVVIRLQQPEKETGITDIELEAPGKFFIIVEAKCGWHLPSRKQLETYVHRPSFNARKGVPRRLVVMSECSREYALLKLGATKIEGVVVHPFSWKRIAEIANQSQRGCSHAEKRILSELLTYLRGLMTMQNVDSNWVYVVSLGGGTPDKWKISWIDIVEKKRRYFHPVGGMWPKEPPNYIGFRYHGKLQTIHHVEGYEIFDDPHDKFREIPSDDWDPHFLYKLGRPFAPANEVRTGNIFRNGRVWCMLDTFFVTETISQARDLSKKRSEQVN
jgi:hypothetical protein